MSTPLPTLDAPPGHEPTRAVDRIVERLRDAGQIVRGAGRDRWQAQCPSHDDREPSLSVAAGLESALLNCHGGCRTEEVLTALNLSLSDLFDRGGRAEYVYPAGHRVTRRPAPGRLGSSKPGKRITQSGAPDVPQLWRHPDSLPLEDAVRDGVPIAVPEGEPAVDAALRLGFTAATCWPGGAAAVSRVDLEPLRAARVVVLPDADEAGERAMQTLLERLRPIAAEVSIWRVPAGDGDVGDTWARGGTLDELTVSPAPESPAAVGSSSWGAADVDGILTDLLAGEHEPERPTLAALEHGGALLYPGRVHSVAGESGSGKSWAALAVVAAVLASGDGAVYVDLEDTPAGVLGRLLALGATADALRARFAYVRPDVPLHDADREALLALVTERRPVLVVIDSAGEALAMDGLSQNEDDAVARWFRYGPRSIATLGPAVLLLDHVVKADDARGLWAIGSQRKRAAIDGAAFILEQRKGDAFSRERAGRARLVVAKDRHGTFRRGQHVADMLVQPDGDRVSIRLVAVADDGASEPGLWRPTGYMERISRVLETSAEPLSYNRICDLVKGKREHLRRAVDLLVVDGFVRTTPGPRNTTFHESAKPFREHDAGEPLSEPP